MASNSSTSDGVIRKLDAYTVQRIGAEQVITCLGDGVKELVENSLDAGASQISITFCNYGIDWFEIADDGSGITDADFELIGQRSATSKLIDYDAISSIGTFGFRGEALHSLCVLAQRVTITSRCESAMCATRIIFESARTQDGAMRVAERSRDRCARQRGTTIRVERLFESIPVRRTDFVARARSTELTRAVTRVEQYALSSVGVRFGCVNVVESRNTQLLRTSGSSAPSKTQLQGGTASLGNEERRFTDAMRSNVVDLFGAQQAATLQRLETHFPPPAEYIAAFNVDETSRTFVPRSVAQRKSAAATATSKKAKMRKSAKQPDSDSDSEKETETETETDADASLVDDPCDTVPKFALCGFISRPDCARSQLQSSTARQFFFINGRPIDFTRLAQVVNDTFRTHCGPPQPNVTQSQSQSQSQSATTQSPLQLQSSVAGGGGRCYPFVALNLLVPDRTLVDVNRAPDKRSVFVQDEAVLLATVKHSLECLFREARYLKISQTQALFNSDSDSPSPAATPLSGVSLNRNCNDAPRSSCSSNERSASRKGKVTPLSDFLKLHAGSNKSPNPSSLTAPPEAEKRDVQREVPRDCLIVHSSRTSDDENANKTENSAQTCVPKVHQTVATAQTHSVYSLTAHQNEATESTAQPKTNEPTDAEEPQGEFEKIHPCSRRVAFSFDKIAATWRQLQREAFVNSSRQRLAADSETATDDSVDQPLFTARIEPSANELAESELRTRFEKRYFGELRVVGQFNLGFIIAAHRRKRPRLSDDPACAAKRVATATATAIDMDLFIVDQHAADEKATFERLERSLDFAARKQNLIRPIDLRLSESDKLVVLENRDVLRRNGFCVVERLADDPPAVSHKSQGQAEPVCIDLDAEPESPNINTTSEAERPSEAFCENEATESDACDLACEDVSGLQDKKLEIEWPDDFPETLWTAQNNKLYLTSVPILGNCTLGFHDFQELLGLLRDSESECERTRKRPSRVRALLASRACRQSVMIGTPLKRVEMKAIISKLSELDQPWNCPHGRPTIRHLCHL